MNATAVAVLGLVVVVVIAVAETFLQKGPGGSLIISLTFWRALAEGAVALVAAAEVSRASWHHPIKARLLAAHPMILVIAVLFVVFIPQMDIYPWWGENHFWAHKWAFIGRHLVWMVATFLAARKLAAESLKRTNAARRYGAIYLLLFALGQSLVGFEWIMSLEKPWFSTLFGAWFAVEAFQSGIVVAAFVLFSMRGVRDGGWKFAQRSVGGLMFGFSIFWAYFYFSQLIVIWYGNIPEETSYLARRISYSSPYWVQARLIFGLCWVVPFTVLLGKRPKMNPSIVISMGTAILLGFMMERWLMVEPVVSVNLVLLALEAIGLGFVLATMVASHEHLLPSSSVASTLGGEMTATRT